MPTLLLRPYLLSYKNRWRKRPSSGGEFVGLLMTVVFASAVFWGTRGFLFALRQAGVEDVLAVRILELVLLGFFFLLLFSNFITALNCFYNAKDNPLLLSVPLPLWRIYSAKLIYSLVAASWMYFLFALPMCLGYLVALNLDLRFLLAMAGVSVLFLLIPAAIAAIGATIFVNLFPSNRVVDFVALLSLGAVVLLLVNGEQLAESLPLGQHNVARLTTTLTLLEQASPRWLPPYWSARVFEPFVQQTPFTAWRELAILTGVALGMAGAGYLVFRRWFMRGWMRVSESLPPRVTRRGVGSWIAQKLIPFDMQLHALLGKELRMFLRDTAQSLQLLFILALTFIYLYNFRTLRLAVPEGSESAKWWLAVLTLSNLAMGGCVAAAIAARFVFPSVSLEGRAYWLLRATPLSITRFLYTKVITWFFPFTLIVLVLLLSGAMAIQAPPITLFVTAVIAVALSYGLVGLGVGIGAVYVRFDWENAAQITSSFGSLVYMLLAFMVIALTILAASYLYFVSCVPALSASGFAYLPMFCSLFLVFFINLTSARTALAAGEETLIALEG